MRAQYILLCCICIGFNACKQPAQRPRATDTLSYSYQTVKRRANNCGNRPDSGCTTAKIKYPVFVRQKVLNDSVRNKLLQMSAFGDPAEKYTSLEQVAEDVVSSYEADVAAGRNTLPTSLDIAVTVLRQDSSLLVLKLNGYAYMGGAHGSEKTLFLNWNTRAGKEVTLDDIFQNDYKPALNKIAERIFRRNEKLSDTASLEDHYSFDKGKFSLNDNFMITPVGLSFLYNEYEIKSYAEGQTTLFIPYAQIKSLIRPKTVVSQYLK